MSRASPCAEWTTARRRRILFTHRRHETSHWKTERSVEHIRHTRARATIARPRPRADSKRDYRSFRRRVGVESRVDDGMPAHREFALTEYSVSVDARKRANCATDAVDGFVKINHGLYVEIPLFARVGLALTNAFYWVLAWKLLRSTGEARAKRSEAKTTRRWKCCAKRETDGGAWNARYQECLMILSARVICVVRTRFTFCLFLASRPLRRRTISTSSVWIERFRGRRAQRAIASNFVDLRYLELVRRQRRSRLRRSR